MGGPDSSGGVAGSEVAESICQCRCETICPSYGGIVMESGSNERTLEWAIEPVAAGIPVEVQIIPPTVMYFEILGVEEPEVELIITI